MPLEIPGSAVRQDAIVEKTAELCGAIVHHPAFAKIQEGVKAFENDEEAVRAFQEVNDRGESLHHKQVQGQRLDPKEVAEFETMRGELLKNPVVLGFLEAQDEMGKIQRSIQEYVAQTFELGRVPNPDEVGGGGHGSCGSGCGCGH